MRGVVRSAVGAVEWQKLLYNHCSGSWTSPRWTGQFLRRAEFPWRLFQANARCIRIQS